MKSFLMTLPRDNRYEEKSKGPKIKPYGTPQNNKKKKDFQVKPRIIYSINIIFESILKHMGEECMPL